MHVYCFTGVSNSVTHVAYVLYCKSLNSNINVLFYKALNTEKCISFYRALNIDISAQFNSVYLTLIQTLYSIGCWILIGYTWLFNVEFKINTTVLFHSELKGWRKMYHLLGHMCCLTVDLLLISCTVLQGVKH